MTHCALLGACFSLSESLFFSHGLYIRAEAFRAKSTGLSDTAGSLLNRHCADRKKLPDAQVCLSLLQEGSENPSHKPHKINGQIASIRLLQEV